MKRIIFYFFCLSLLISLAHAQTVSVKSGGGGDYSTINDAYAAVKANAATPDIINIQDVGPYLENIMINTSVTIKGDGVKPTIVSTPTSGGPHSSTDGNAISIYTDTGSGGDITVHLENFILLPDTTTQPTRGIRSNNNATGLSTDKMTVEMVDLLVAPNNGSNQPVTTDGMNIVDLTGAAKYADDLTYFTGYVDVSCSGCIFSNNYGAGVGSADGLIFYPDTVGYYLTVGPGCVFSYMNRIGLQVATDGCIVRMNGTKDNPIIIKGNWADKSYTYANGGLAIFHDCNGVPSYNYECNYVYMCDNNNQGIVTSYADAGEGLPGVTFNNCAFVNNQQVGVSITDDLIQPWVFNNCTFANNGLDTSASWAQLNIGEETVGGTTANITFTDCIIAGNGEGDSTDGNNSISINASSANVSFSYTSLVQYGSNRLSTAFVLGSGVPAPLISNGQSADPEFVSLDCGSSDFVDVVSLTYYQKGSGGTDLSGAGDYVGGIPMAADPLWNLYE
ncbi:hypothetical protein JW926_07335 [Candidatus Sumerlaeota bacterium]|nr:hypothetical protein [Candidatus Sumerlaeota bacterium]